MTVRTTETTITFRHPFWLSCFERPQPAGTYRLVFDDEEILGVSFLAYHRSATMLHTPPISVTGGAHQVFSIDSQELASALAVDAQA
jgi:hypothetical protein